ncbi:hypothetical protein KUA00_05190 [Proteus mirabilis]|uniref:hypothetical protein n=1 Tax=Proteus mirabilis TaxID=584 RepID=UPI0018C5007E|nr:hypothetical protein [Proteus mirabilis]MBG3058779.1 hypothetical protein [Proteus mirabilis]MCL8609226.1 hypothetical protein [Proteus mirabilis]MCT0124405.1 hypothetical protein [Proteus mirabilis]MCU9587203.1 hypothetical protein [Proteus mirabilis]MDF7337830.1 hypothetical protein [Proteus mirabilis]
MQKDNISFIYKSIIIFLLINSFYIYPPINSSFLAPLFSLFYLCHTNKYKFKVYFFYEPYFLLLLLSILFMAGINILITSFHNKYDFTYTSNFISQFIQLFFIVFTISIINNEDKKNKLEYYIITSFVLQSIIQIFGFIFPSIAEIIHLSYPEDKIARLYTDYGGIRGLALTGSPGWGLSVGYAICFVLYTKNYLIIKTKIPYSTYLIGILLFIGAFFSGRTAFLGILFSAIYYILKMGSKNFFYLTIKIIILLIILSLSIMILFNDIWLIFQNKVFPFVFEMFYNLSNTGNLTSKSTNILSKMWDVNINTSEFLLGSGLFTDSDNNSYYKSIDVGYLRNILYGGIGWELLLILYQTIIFFLFSKRTNSFLLENFILFFMLLLLEAKAMTIGYNKYMFTIIVIYTYSLILQGKKNVA